MSNATKVENTRNICAGAAFAIERGNGPVTTTYATTDDGWTVSADIATEAVYGSAVNENHESSFMRSGLNFMHGERRGIQVNQQKTNHAKIGDEPAATKVGALENDMDAIALKLGKMLKMLDTMLATKKKYRKSNFNSGRDPRHDSRMDRQLPHAEEQELQGMPTFTLNGGDIILGQIRPRGQQPSPGQGTRRQRVEKARLPVSLQGTGEKVRKTGAATSTSRRGRANSHGDGSDTHNQYQYLASEQVRVLPDAIKERDQHYARTATIRKQSKKADNAMTSREGRSSQTLGKDDDSDTEIPVYFSSPGLARIRVCRPTADLQDCEPPAMDHQETTESGLSLCESDQDQTSAFGKRSTTPSTQPDAEATSSECIPRATKASEDGAPFILGEQPTTPSDAAAIRVAEGECIPKPAAVPDDSASTNNVFVFHDEGTTGKSAQRLLPRPGMDSDPSVPLETSLSPPSPTVGKDTSRGTNVPRESAWEYLSYIDRQSCEEASDVDREPPASLDYVYPSTEEPTVVVTSSRDEDLIKTTRIQLLGADDDHAVDLDAGAILRNPLHSKRWKEPDKTNAQCMEHEEELDCDTCRSIELGRIFGIFRDNTEVVRCTSGKRHDLPGPEPTTEPVTSYLGVPVPSTQKPETKGPTTRSKSRLAATVFQEIFQPPTATLPLSK